MKEKFVFLSLVLIFFASILKSHKNVLRLAKFFYRFLAISISGFFSYKIAPLLPGAFLEAIHGLVPAPLIIVTLSYLLLIFAGSLMYWQVTDNCTIQLKNRFDIAP